jgi:predicted DNA-binding protein (UPF0251 family)
VDNEIDKLAAAALFLGCPGHARREGLPEDEGEVFDLVGVQGLTHAEAAAVVGVSQTTVSQRLNRARLLLSEQLVDFRPADDDKVTR